MGLQAPFGRLCLHLPFLPLQPQEETALRSASEVGCFAETFCHQDTEMINGAICDLGSGVERDLPLISFSRVSRLNPVISFPVGYRGLVCVLPKPHLLGFICFWKLWVINGKVWELYLGFEGKDTRIGGFFLNLGLFLKLGAVKSFFIHASKRNNYRSLYGCILIPLVHFYSYFIHKTNIF